MKLQEKDSFVLMALTSIRCYDLAEVGSRFQSFNSRKIKWYMDQLFTLLLRKEQSLFQMTHVLPQHCHAPLVSSALVMTFMEGDKQEECKQAPGSSFPTTALCFYCESRQSSQLLQPIPTCQGQVLSCYSRLSLMLGNVKIHK